MKPRPGRRTPGRISSRGTKHNQERGTGFMRKVTFEQDEMLVMAMFDAGNRKHTLERIEEVIPYIQDDIDKDRLVVLAGFIRLNSSSALISMETDDFKEEGTKGNWIAEDEIIVDERQFYLLQNDVYKNEVPYVVVSEDGKAVTDESKGFDETTIQRLRDFLQPQEKPLPVPEKTQMEQWQKYYENGEYLWSAEMTEEQNYNMIDGRMNNISSKKQSKQTGKVHNSVYHQCRKRGYAAPADVLMDLGILEKQKYEQWRFGKVPYLEAVCNCNLRQMSFIMKQIRFYAEKSGLKPSFCYYKQWGAKKKSGQGHKQVYPLRFSKSSKPEIEKAYATPYVDSARAVALKEVREQKEVEDL